MYKPTAYDKTTDTVLICLQNLGFIFPIFYSLVKIIHSTYLKNAVFYIQGPLNSQVFSVLLLDNNQNMTK